MSKLLMLQGIPGCGKTTLAKNLELNGWIRVNKDDIRTELEATGWVWSKKEEAKVIAIRDQRIINALRLNNVVSDDPNFARVHKTRLQQIAQDCGAEFKITHIDLPLAECLIRNGNREGKARVPDHVIVKMWEDNVRENPYNFPISANPSKVAVEPVVFDNSLMPAIICDLDGTLAINRGHRGVYDARTSDKDELNRVVWNIITLFSRHNQYQIIYLTGRQEEFREPSQRFLDIHYCPKGPLYMREDRDSRNSVTTKVAMFNEHISGRYNVMFCLEDLDKICKVWTELGLPVLKVHNYGL